MLFQRQLSHKLDLSNVEFTIQSVKYKEQPEATIKPELYRQNVTLQSNKQCDEMAVDSHHISKQKTCGRLYFSVIYNRDLDQLIVTLQKAEKLPAKDFSGTSDPYVKIYLLPERKNKYQTKVHRKTLNPTFNEKFIFHVCSGDRNIGDELYGRTLQFSVYDFDRFSRHDLIGVVVIRDLNYTDFTYEQQYCMDVINVQQVK